MWPFPLGAWYLAYLKVNEYSAKAKRQVRRQLAALEPALREGCAGQLPEIYDGENPCSRCSIYFSLSFLSVFRLGALQGLVHPQQLP